MVPLLAHAALVVATHCALCFRLRASIALIAYTSLIITVRNCLRIHVCLCRHYEDIQVKFSPEERTGYDKMETSLKERYKAVRYLLMTAKVK
jgi:hypothetical protein